MNAAVEAVEAVPEKSQGGMHSVEHRISRRQRFMMNAGSTILLLKAQTRDILKGIVNTDEDAMKRAKVTPRSLHLKDYEKAKRTPRPARPEPKADTAPKAKPTAKAKTKPATQP